MTAGSVGGWRSRDAGQTWEEVAVPSSYYVSSLVLDPRDPDQYYAVVNWDPPVTLLRSADAGGHWEEVALPEISPSIGTVIFDHRGQRYAGASRVLPGFFFSPGDGQEWVWQGGEGVWAASYSDPLALLYVDAQQPQIAIAAAVSMSTSDGRTIYYKYLRSTDGGRSWKRVWLGESDFFPFVADPRQAGVYYLTYGGVQRSADYGETWEDRSAGLPRNEWGSREAAGLALAVRAEAAVLYAAIANTDSLWRSKDEGLHWEYAGTLGEGERIAALAINPLAADNLYAVTDHGGVYVSADQGQGWTRLRPGEYEWFERVRLRFDPVDPERFFVVTGPRLLETRDGGQHWRSLGDGLASVPWFNDVAVDPLAPHLLYAATPWGLYRLDTSTGVTAVEETGAVPQHFALHPNYPNPFNPSTTIRFSLAQTGEVELAIYDLLGQQVAVLVHGVQEAGAHQVVWNGRDDAGRALASGVYLCRLRAGVQVETRRLLLLR